MRAYLIDEIPAADVKKLRDFLHENAITSELEALYWVPLPPDLLSEIQYQHSDCQPFVFAVELGQDWMKLELFVRSLAGMRCECQGYCTSQQRDFVINFTHKILEDLNVRT